MDEISLRELLHPFLVGVCTATRISSRVWETGRRLALVSRDLEYICLLILFFPMWTLCPNLESLHLGSTNIWDRTILCGEAGLGHIGCLITSLVSTHWMPVASIPLPHAHGVINKNVSPNYQVSPVGYSHPDLRGTALILPGVSQSRSSLSLS